MDRSADYPTKPPPTARIFLKLGTRVLRAKWVFGQELADLQELFESTFDIEELNLEAYESEFRLLDTVSRIWLTDFATDDITPDSLIEWLPSKPALLFEAERRLVTLYDLKLYAAQSAATPSVTTNTNTNTNTNTKTNNTSHPTHVRAAALPAPVPAPRSGELGGALSLAREEEVRTNVTVRSDQTGASTQMADHHRRSAPPMSAADTETETEDTTTRDVRPGRGPGPGLGLDQIIAPPADPSSSTKDHEPSSTTTGPTSPTATTTPTSPSKRPGFFRQIFSSSSRYERPFYPNPFYPDPLAHPPRTHTHTHM